VLLAADIDRGGVFASLVGTLALLAPEERALVKGFLINKFRGDLGLLQPGLDFLVQRTGVPVLGVIPYLRHLRIADEDSVALEQPSESHASTAGPLEIAVVRVPHIANFDDFDLLAAEPAVHLRYVERAEAFGQPDLIILPGSKATVADLHALRTSGIAARLTALIRAGTPVLGICGGYQMLGRRLLDPLAVESTAPAIDGLGLLPVETTFQGEKRTRRVRARALAANSWLGMIAHREIEGYEIHMGATPVADGALLDVRAEGEAWHHDGCCSADGLICGTYLHGLFEAAPVRTALVRWLATRRGLGLGIAGEGGVPSREAEYDRLAETVRSAIDMDMLRGLLPPRHGGAPGRRTPA
jgi:adenosylcobyric acid synthase